LSGSEEGFLEWNGYRTWFRVVGKTDAQSSRLPLIICHGGPGMASDYCEPIADLSRQGRVCVLYDQLGCGRSQHLSKAPTDFWTMELFKEELYALIQHLGFAERYAVAGQSCGGMLALEHGLDHPTGLRGLVICDSMASFPLWVEEADRLRAELPVEVEAVLRSHEGDGSTDHPDYVAATQVFYDRHLCRVPWPECLVRSFDQLERDPTVYHAMNGPSEFHVIGNLKDWDVTGRLTEINVPTVLISGRYDEATPRIQQEMKDRIPDVEWVLLEHSSHLPQIEEPEAFLEAAGAFLARLDAAL
jgi:L-proline amide hydrolase